LGWVKSNSGDEAILHIEIMINAEKTLIKWALG